jgi:hypothetical protein
VHVPAPLRNDDARGTWLDKHIHAKLELPIVQEIISTLMITLIAAGRHISQQTRSCQIAEAGAADHFGTPNTLSATVSLVVSSGYNHTNTPLFSIACIYPVAMFRSRT